MIMFLSSKDFNKLNLQGLGPNKYQNIKATYNGVEYDSTKEADFAASLDAQKDDRGKNKVLKWQRQVKYSIDIDGQHICNYFLDFKVWRASGEINHYDIKGYKKGQAYSLFRLKKKLVEAIHKIKIEEV